ncbi:uncharacterized protein LOC135155258 [Lytechinus pictus]|uniref:uncharacterized protein LOC135155258 n=1 Tax=Lytechinus pictus TaxID=7653 RepID=UPI0030B9B296
MIYRSYIAESEQLVRAIIGQYIHFPKSSLWLQSDIKRDMESVVIKVYESCVNGNCHHGTCSYGVCSDITNEYSCQCEPGYGGLNCVQDIGVQEWILDWPNGRQALRLSDSVTCKVNVSMHDCGIEYFLHGTKSIDEYSISLVIRTSDRSGAKSTILTDSNGEFNEYGYLNRSNLWFQLYTTGFKRGALIMSAKCDMYEQGI